MGKSNEKYQTNHPIIKEITIGDIFVTKNNILIKFIRTEDELNLKSFKFRFEYVSTRNTTTHYDRELKHWCDENYDIKSMYISLKGKLYQL
jgi:hypothetical protein